MIRNKACRGRALKVMMGIAVLVLLMAGGAGAATIYVPDNYAKIQWAVDNASGGDTIIVRNGIYYENVKINKPLTIRCSVH
ncbi:periplasmic copper-binding protein [groundwater metagenome]